MKAAWLSLGLGGAVLVVGCGTSGTDKPANTAGAISGATSAGSGTSGSGSAGMNAGGSPAQGGGGATGGGNAASGSSGSGTAGGDASGGTGTVAFQCPAGAAVAPVLTGLTPVRVEGVPPADDFNDMNNAFTNIEGDVWIGDALYVSEINPNPKGGTQGMAPPGRVLKITADDKVSVLLPDSGSNGLATNAAGELFGAIHKDGSISKLSLSGGAAVPIASMFMGMRFDSPNDLTIHKSGTIYFTDPSYQSPMPIPQAATRAYRVPPGGMPVAIDEFNQPNGITLSKNQDFLYIGGNQLKKYPVMADGSLGAGSTFVEGGHGDGMVVDCGDNLYVAPGGAGPVTVYSSAGQSIGTITVGLEQTTNLAFGGADHKTLYVSGQGGKTGKGLFKIAMNVPGFPY